MNKSAGPNRRTFLKASAIGAASAAGVAGLGAGAYWIGSKLRAPKSTGKKVIVIGVDGMDPLLCKTMIDAGSLPNLAKLRDQGGFSPLGTSIPPQSPVAWASFINGSGPGSHGIFDFIHRHPEEQCKPFYAAAETIGDETFLRRQGVPFWDYLDAAGVPTTFFDLPSNYPPSPSGHGHHRCISGMGTPDMRGGYGTYQLFVENAPEEKLTESGGERYKLTFTDDRAAGTIIGPEIKTFNGTMKKLDVEFTVDRNGNGDGALIEVQGLRILLKAGQWSRWTRLVFRTPWYTLSNVTGIVRFYLQEAAPNFRLYVSPVNMDPGDPTKKMSEPDKFIQQVSRDLGPFATTGFQEDYNARRNGVFADDEYLKQAGMVLEERLKLLDRALSDYDDGLLFFYFSSCDLQSHIFWWWGSDDQHPIRSPVEATWAFSQVWGLYQTLDRVVGDIMDRFGSQATIFVMSDHGFANFGRQFNLNSWLRDFSYLGPGNATSIMEDVDWSSTYAYGLGINGLYLNKKGRERDGIVEPGEMAERYLRELKERLEDVVDFNGQRVISNVYRASEVYTGSALEFAPDLIVGYSRGYRASWATSLGELTDEILLDNDSPWSADHCADALEVPGVLFSNRPLRVESPSLVDVAPTILAEFGLPTPSTMSGKSIV